MVGSRKRGASSAATPRPASTRATMSAMPWPWAMASAERLLALGQPMFPGKPGRRLPDIEERAGRGSLVPGCRSVGVHAQVWPRLSIASSRGQA